jgi:hypothetical protein
MSTKIDVHTSTVLCSANADPALGRGLPGIMEFPTARFSTAPEHCALRRPHPDDYRFMGKRLAVIDWRMTDGRLLLVLAPCPVLCNPCCDGVGY